MASLPRLVALLIGIIAGLSSVVAQRHLKWADKGDSLLHIGSLQESLVAYERSFRMRKNSRAAFGIGECKDGLDVDGASSWYRQAIDLAKREYTSSRMVQEKVACILRIGYAHQRLGEHEQAIEWFARDNCKGRLVYLEMGRSFMALVNYTEALQALKTYERYYPGGAADLITECERALGN